MSNYNNTKATIAANVYTNHANQVTAEMVKTAINAVVDTIIAGGFLYKGVAIPTTNPGSPDANVAYIAATAGTYTNFGGLVVADGEVAVLKYNGSWSKEVTGAATAAQVAALGHKVGDNTHDISNRVKKPLTLPDGTSGQVLRTLGDGNTEWVNVGLPTDQQTKDAIDEWLDAHPEATTTIQDGAVTMPKLDANLQARVGYWKNVLEFPGATFTDKLQAAVDSAETACLIIFIPPGDYEVTTPIIVSSSTMPFKIAGQPSYTANGTSRIHAPNGFISFTQNVAVTISDLAIYGDTDSGTIVGLSLGYQRWMKLERLFVSGFSKGISSGSSSLPYTWITNCEVRDCGIGVAIKPVGTILRDCHIHGCSSIGLQVNSGNSLAVNGLVEESNATQVEINGTDFVSISQSYIGDSATGWLSNNGGTHISISDMIQSIGETSAGLSQSAGSLELSGEYFSANNGISITGGTLDIYKLKTRHARYGIENSGGFVRGDYSKYQVGYLLDNASGSAVCPSEFHGVISDTADNNFAGDPIIALNSQINPSVPSLHMKSPGIAYHFKVPARFVGQTIYLHFKYEILETSIAASKNVDIFLVGAVTQGDAFDVATYNIVTTDPAYQRIRPLSAANAQFHAIPIKISAEDIYLSIANVSINGAARADVAKISYIYISEDGRMLIPTPWAAE